MVIAVPAVDRNRANVAALTFDPGGGGHTFERGMSADHGATITHYVCSVAMPNDAVFSAVMGLKDVDFPGAMIIVFDIEDNPRGAVEALATMGLVDPL